MNLPLDIAVCIGGPCAQKDKCARWVVYDSLVRAKQDGKTDFDPRVIITTPPFTYDDGCFYFMPTTRSEHES
jgi:hypothetical protein